MLKSLLQFGDGLQFFLVIITIPSVRLCSALLVSFFLIVIYIMHIFTVTSPTTCSHIYFMSDTVPESKRLTAAWKCFCKTSLQKQFSSTSHPSDKINCKQLNVNQQKKKNNWMNQLDVVGNFIYSWNLLTRMWYKCSYRPNNVLDLMSGIRSRT